MFPAARDELPDTYVRPLDTVFARFGADTQDSSNVLYGVSVGGRRFFVTASRRIEDFVD